MIAVESHDTVDVFYVKYDYTYEEWGSCLSYTEHDNFIVIIDHEEEPYCDWFAEGWNTMEVLEEILFNYHCFGDYNTWTIYDEFENLVDVWTD